ncbi:hypothetical protein HK101_006175 [Irineochytrium annulatum]|nr:hypothetical protein HK101_006175 [Irineochytrium annulatum]
MSSGYIKFTLSAQEAEMPTPRTFSLPLSEFIHFSPADGSTTLLAFLVLFAIVSVVAANAMLVGVYYRRRPCRLAAIFFASASAFTIPMPAVARRAASEMAYFDDGYIPNGITFAHIGATVDYAWFSGMMALSACLLLAGTGCMAVRILGEPPLDVDAAEAANEIASRSTAGDALGKGGARRGLSACA